VLVIDRHDRVLLLLAHDPNQLDKGQWWHVPGGGLDAGESPQQGAERELREEIALHTGQLGEPVHTEVVDLVFDGQAIRQRQWFFVAHIHEHTVDFAGHDEYERKALLAARWWTADELRLTHETFYPACLPELVHRAVTEGKARAT
jgi:8-oxo-dGTP pyrophosphatase MutT (NUDIX family)